MINTNKSFAIIYETKGDLLLNFFYTPTYSQTNLPGILRSSLDLSTTQEIEFVELALGFLNNSVKAMELFSSQAKIALFRKASED